MPSQAKVILALSILHNFIRIHDPSTMEELDEIGGDDTVDGQGRVVARVGAGEIPVTGVSEDESKRAEERRDDIAKAMWDSYLQERRRRGEVI